MADCKLFPQDVIDNVQSIIDQPIDNMGVITKWNTILEVLKDHVYVLEDVSTSRRSVSSCIRTTGRNSA